MSLPSCYHKFAVITFWYSSLFIVVDLSATSLVRSVLDYVINAEMLRESFSFPIDLFVNSEHEREPNLPIINLLCVNRAHSAGLVFKLNRSFREMSTSVQLYRYILPLKSLLSLL